MECLQGEISEHLMTTKLLETYVSRNLDGMNTPHLSWNRYLGGGLHCRNNRPLLLRPTKNLPQGPNWKVTTPTDLVPKCQTTSLLSSMKCPKFFFKILISKKDFFRATGVSYGSSQARARIRATAAGLCHRHSHTRYELCLHTMQQLVAMPDP